MIKKPYKPQSIDGILSMLVAFDTNASATGGTLATKYGLTAATLARIKQARLSWQFLLDIHTAAKNWGQSLIDLRDVMLTGAAGATAPLPGGPVLPALPVLSVGPPVVNAQLEPGFFTFFSSVVDQIKDNTAYSVADGQLLGIEGAIIAPPNAATTLPLVTGKVLTNGEPELNCLKGPFQGYTVWLTRPGQAKKQIGFSTSRRYRVIEPLPASGTAEIWTFEVQYRYKNQPFGQTSQPYNLTVRG